MDATGVETTSESTEDLTRNEVREVPSAPGERDGLGRDDDVLVEEISIDGMCGVY